MKCKNCPALRKTDHYCRREGRKVSWLVLFLKKRPKWCSQKYYPRYFRTKDNKNRPLR